MAICQYCKQDMLTTKGCYYSRLKTSDGKIYRRMKMGEEGYFEPTERCGDCGAEYGYYHHFGCDIERCPICGQQLISCECLISELLK